MKRELRNFRGERAIFIHNAFYATTPGFVTETDPLEYAKSIQANAVAPLVLGEMFLRAVRPAVRIRSRADVFRSSAPSL